jgi:hypothetical protein
VLQTILGAVLFNDFVPTAQNIVGILVSFMGAGLFSYTKLRDALAGSRESSKKKEDLATAGAGAPTSPLPTSSEGTEETIRGKGTP